MVDINDMWDDEEDRLSVSLSAKPTREALAVRKCCFTCGQPYGGVGRVCYECVAKERSDEAAKFEAQPHVAALNDVETLNELKTWIKEYLL